ncbi:MAG: lanthionine synthetase LanC family protein, partial [Candidatus Thorarchaeota archaeon]
SLTSDYITRLPNTYLSTSYQNISSLNSSYLSNAEQLANLLILYANNTGYGLKWRQVLNFVDSSAEAGVSQFYSGYFLGAAGIGDEFLELYSLTSNSSYLQIAERSASYIISQAVYYNGRIYWTRSEDSSTPYIGIKYGYAGIAKFFLNIYENTHNNTYLEYAKKII